MRIAQLMTGGSRRAYRLPALALPDLAALFEPQADVSLGGVSESNRPALTQLTEHGRPPQKAPNLGSIGFPAAAANHTPLPTYPKTRVWGFGLPDETRIETERSVSTGTTWACGSRSGRTASGSGEFRIFDPNGNALSTSAYGWNRLFQGREYIPMLDAYDFRARTLWPELGRFGQEDPEGLVPGGPIGNRPGSKSPELNLYAFARGNPLTYVDPSGRWPSKGPILAHQQAIDDALSFLPASDRAILKAQQAAIDAHQFQGTADSPIHAMTPLGRPRESAIRQANNFVRGGIILARQLEASGKHVEALKVLGDAMHTLQDSTSPSHRGFQEWSEEWGATTKEGRRHVDNELYYPGPRSELVDITRRAWSYFTGALDMPSDFFSVSAREQAHATVMNALPE